MRYYIADCHFYHKAMNDRMDERGFASVEDMNQFMIHQWNKRVKKQDEIVILGDLSFAKWEETESLIKSLNGKKYLIVGNHDRYVNHPNFDSSLFKKISRYDEMQDNCRTVILCHYPVFCYNGQNKLDRFENPKAYMLHGHIHDTKDQVLVDQFVKETKQTKRMIQGVERNIPCHIINCFTKRSNYSPLTLDEWINLDNQRISQDKN